MPTKNQLNPLLPALIALSTSVTCSSKELKQSSSQISKLSLGSSSFSEPLSKSTIEILDRAVQDPGNNPLKTQVAALLYRYGSSKGLVVLRGRAARGDVLAATVLASAQDKASKSKILRGFNSQKSMDPELVLALGNWRDPQISMALYNAYAAHPDNGNIALALARQSNSRALKLIKQRFWTSASRAASDQQVNLALALTALDPDNNHQLVLAINRALETGTAEKPFLNPGAAWELVSGLNYLGGETFRPTFLNALRKHVESGKIHPQEFSSPSGATALLSIDYFATHGRPQDAELLLSFVKQCGNAPEVLYSDSLKSRAAVAILKLDPISGAKRLALLGTTNWLERVQRIATLRPVPRRILSYTPEFGKYLLEYVRR